MKRICWWAGLAMLALTPGLVGVTAAGHDVVPAFQIAAALPTGSHLIRVGERLEHEAQHPALGQHAEIVPVTAGNGTLLFDGTFTTAHWPSKYGTCGSVISTDRARFALTTNCNPGGDGHYRTDWCSSPSCDHGRTGDYYAAGKTTCTSIPVRFTSVGSVPGSGWFQFAEAKDNEGVGAGWGFDLFTSGGHNYVGVEMFDYGGHAAWGEPFTDTVPVDTGWHTWSICTNNANTNAGVVQGLWKDGVRQTFNHGAQAGHTSLSGFPIIDDGAANWPLDINDYTGGAPVPNMIIHGAPLIATLGSNGLPPEQAGGWNSP